MKFSLIKIIQFWRIMKSIDYESTVNNKDTNITNPVPFDANVGANGALSGGGKMGHRVTAIGHDPLLGLIFGTANIATSTLTTMTFDSYHIYTNDNNRDYFRNHARTDLMIAMVHGLFFDGETSSNLAIVVITKDMKKLDFGGLAVTIYRLITDAKFIRQVKEDYACIP